MNPATVCRAIFRDLKDAYGLEFMELQLVWNWPTFFDRVEHRLVVFQVKQIH